MKTFLSRFLLAVCSLASMPAARAAFSPALVPADARWVVYADMNAVRESAVGKELLAAAQKAQPEVMGGHIAIDAQRVLSTVGTITAYGSNLSADSKLLDGTLIAQGTPELRKIAESLLLQATIANPKAVTEITDLPFPAYGIMSGPGGAKEKQPDLIIAFPPEPIVLVSKSRSQLTKARNLFLGSGESLAKSPSSTLAKLLAGAKNSFLCGASLVPSEKIFPDTAPQARILQMATSGSLAFGENGAETTAHAQLNASSPASAEKLRKILEGMTAMLSLTESTDKQLTDFLNATTVTKEGDTVTLDISYPSARLVSMVQSTGIIQGAKEAPQAPRQPPITIGKSVEEWSAEAVANPPAGSAPIALRVIEHVELKNGSVITLGRQANGGRNVRFDQVEIVPAEGGGAPLVFRTEFMRAAGPRGNMAQFQFPGADGVYTLKVGYLNDSDGKTRYAVSVRDPAPRPTDGKAKE